MQGIIKIFVALAVATMFAACDENPEAMQTAPPEGYNRLHSPLPHSFRRGFSSVGDPVRLGKASERFELRDGDCGGSDCTEPRSRSEIQMRDDINPAKIGQDIWYGWSFYNATVPSFTKENSLRLVFGQWTVGGQQRPIFRLIQLGSGEGDFDKCDPRVCAETTASKGDIVVQLADVAEAGHWGDAQNNGYVCRLFDIEKQRGRWVDLTVNTNFSSGRDGYLRIWMNGQLVCNYKGQLVSAASVRTGRPPEHRRGIFSSWDKRWIRATGDESKPSFIVYYDEFRVGATRGDVDILARIANAAKAAAVD